jgi:hypothetical protein
MLMNKEKGDLREARESIRPVSATANLMDDPAFGPEVTWLF